MLEAAEHDLVAVDRMGRALDMHPDENEMDRGGRYYPAHLDLEDVNDPWDVFGRMYWWGWWRIAWWPTDPAVPRRTFVRVRNEFYNRPLRGP